MVSLGSWPLSVLDMASHVRLNCRPGVRCRLPREFLMPFCGTIFRLAAPLLAATVLLSDPGLASDANAAMLAPHRAVYDLELGTASERSGISQMYGRMVYEFTGSECEGYRVNFRFVTRIDTAGESKVTDQQTTSFEDLRANTFEFDTRSYSGKTLDKEVSGNASKSAGRINVDLFAPASRQIDLADSRFPTEHMKEVIEKARSGVRFFESRIFDGSDNADKTLFTTTVMGQPVTPAADDPDASNAGALGAKPAWPVTIAYFNDLQGKDALPIYRISFKLYDNGVTRDLTMDYGDFVLKGRLADLKLLESKACGQN